ncbi:MAG TPA: Hpt domain-containing protein, partial [Noviherbaspirillum sp.]
QVFASGTQSLEQAAQQNQLETMSELLDSTDALRRVGGNMALYRKLLAQFTASHADAPQRIRALLDTGDVQGAAGIAHSTRGVAANLGATVMAGLGAGLEDALNKGGDTAALLDGFERACRATMEAVRAMVPEAEVAEAPAGGEPAAVDPASLQVMQKLAALLAAGDADAVDFFAGHRKALRLALRDQADAIERAIGDFDFEAALDLLRATANEI